MLKRSSFSLSHLHAKQILPSFAFNLITGQKHNNNSKGKKKVIFCNKPQLWTTRTWESLPSGKKPPSPTGSIRALSLCEHSNSCPTSRATGKVGGNLTTNKMEGSTSKYRCYTCDPTEFSPSASCVSDLDAHSSLPEASGKQHSASCKDAWNGWGLPSLPLRLKLLHSGSLPQRDTAALFPPRLSDPVAEFQPVLQKTTRTGHSSALIHDKWKAAKRHETWLRTQTWMRLLQPSLTPTYILWFPQNYS